MTYQVYYYSRYDIIFLSFSLKIWKTNNTKYNFTGIELQYNDISLEYTIEFGISCSDSILAELRIDSETSPDIDSEKQFPCDDSDDDFPGNYKQKH